MELFININDDQPLKRFFLEDVLEVRYVREQGGFCYIIVSFLSSLLVTLPVSLLP